MTSRRDFVKSAAGAGLGATLVGAFPFTGLAAGRPSPAFRGAPFVQRARVTPVVIASGNGRGAVTRAMEVLQGGGDTLEAVVRGVNLVEEDPEDDSVGYGGLPNAEGVVQLDASVMHGPTRGAGAVAALEGVRTPSLVAVAVMRYTDHVMLVGEGARRFARDMGFRTDEDLLTAKSRQRWLEQRARLADDDDWLMPGESGEPLRRFRLDPARDSGGGQDASSSYDGVRPMGTINCNAVDRDGNLSSVTTTSGLFFKVPGRIGDSPIVGAGQYTDNDVGSAGSTGRGEAVIKTCASHAIVEAMRGGASPTDACLEACRRIVRWTVEKRLLDERGRPRFQVEFYALNRRGEFGSAAIWSGAKYAISVDGRTELRDSAHLLERA